MKATDFLNWNNKRIKILVNDEYKYIDFDDIHITKPDFYVLNTFVLAKTDSKTMEIVNKITEGAMEKLISMYEKDEFKKENIYSLFKDKKIKKILAYVTYVYYHCAYETNHLFRIHENQVFTAYDACKIFLMNQIKK